MGKTDKVPSPPATKTKVLLTAKPLGTLTEQIVVTVTVPTTEVTTGVLVIVPVGCKVKVGVEVQPKALVAVAEATTGVEGVVGIKLLLVLVQARGITTPT